MNRLKSIVLVVLAATMAVGAIVLPATMADAQGSAALSITPRKNYTIEPGKGVEDTLTIRNLDQERELNLSLRAVDFTFTDDGGTPKLMLAEDAPQTTWSLKPFLTLPENVTVEPGGSATVDIGVDIPQNQGAGSFYSAIVYSSGASEGGQVGLSASGVTLAFVTIPGEVNEQLTLEKLGTYNTETKKYKRFNLDMPHRIAYTLNNQGNVVEAPAGSITLRDIFGRETTINDINPNGSLALIGQTRTFESCVLLANEEMNFSGSRQEATTCVNPKLWPGFYRVELNAFYGQNGNLTQELSGKSWFIYAPWWFILAVIAIVAYLTFRIWRIVRYIKARRSGQGGKRTPRNKKK